jgi:hypothetical protein
MQQHHGIGIKTDKNRTIGQTIEPRNQSMFLQSTDFWMKAQRTYSRKKTIFNKWPWENMIYMYRRMKLDSFNPIQKSTQNELKT